MQYWKRLLFLLVFIVAAVHSYANDRQSATPTKTNSHSLTQLYHQLPNNASAYQLSLPLLASAMSQDTMMYQTLLPKMLRALTNPAQHTLNQVDMSLSYQAWLLGRTLIAAKYINDQGTAEKASAMLKRLLQNDTIAHDEFYTWAWAYLLTYYADQPELYKQYKTNMLNAADAYVTQHPNKIDNIVWTRVMELQAIAAANDKLQYDSLLTLIKKDSHERTVRDAIANIPTEDYQAWASAIVTYAAAKMDDNETYQIMQDYTHHAIQAISNDNSFKAIDGAVLAKLTSQQAKQVYEETLLASEAKNKKHYQSEDFS